MNIGRYDLHFLFDAGTRTVKVFDATGALIFQAEARNRTTNQGSYSHNGNLPPGEYVFGRPVPKNAAPFGPYFVPILDAPGHDELGSRGRSGLGWHGGGSGLTDPLADRQSPPWVVTHGCYRSINHDVRHGVTLISEAQNSGGVCWVTNVAALPGASAEEGPDDYADVDPALLADDE